MLQTQISSICAHLEQPPLEQLKITFRATSFRAAQNQITFKWLLDKEKPCPK
jgi:uncharacterized glyoxalase superfamily metalloenzyme YdcJ